MFSKISVLLSFTIERNAFPIGNRFELGGKIPQSVILLHYPKTLKCHFVLYKVDAKQVRVAAHTF